MLAIYWFIPILWWCATSKKNCGGTPLCINHICSAYAMRKFYKASYKFVYINSKCTVFLKVLMWKKMINKKKPKKTILSWFNRIVKAFQSTEFSCRITIFTCFILLSIVIQILPSLSISNFSISSIKTPRSVLRY